ncbi:hypothetical protein F4821DRAFT_256779 [Hypoxylon rubiginosum]|uniref:Uncharacterized protein n=1 Tax=Hypoxylon rubiginosum TaxID=110542 RepID=A0ACC0DAJ5_9PEZI|nr:hypothetical protein F4821DRAFT_256779 [Hypoxylon rubiginosum]
MANLNVNYTSRYSRSVSPKTRVAPVTLSREHHAGSDSEDDDEAVSGVSPYLPFPPSMNMSYSWLKTLYICGASRDERLYAVEVHTGYSGRLPLGTRPGLILHNGTSTKDPILAAVGDESQMAARFYTFNLNSVLLLPPLSGRKASPGNLVTEGMRARTLGDRGFAFRFSVEVSKGGRLRRETFEWRSIKKGERDEARDGGFKLVQVGGPETPDALALAGSSSGSGSSKATDEGCEVLALLSWTKTWWVNHPFALQFKGSGLSGALGERWTLAAVMTALRIWYLRINLKSNRGIISLSETIRGK